MNKERPKDWYWNNKYVETEEDDELNVKDDLQ